MKDTNHIQLRPCRLSLDSIVLSVAFGSTCLPMAVGEHEVICHTWSPVGPAGEELAGNKGRGGALPLSLEP